MSMNRSWRYVTAAANDLVLPKKRGKNGLVFDTFRFKPADTFLPQTFKDLLTILTDYLPTGKRNNKFLGKSERSAQNTVWS